MIAKNNKYRIIIKTRRDGQKRYNIVYRFLFIFWLEKYLFDFEEESDAIEHLKKLLDREKLKRDCDIVKTEYKTPDSHE